MEEGILRLRRHVRVGSLRRGLLKCRRGGEGEGEQEEEKRTRLKSGVPACAYRDGGYRDRYPSGPPRRDPYREAEYRDRYPPPRYSYDDRSYGYPGRPSYPQYDPYREYDQRLPPYVQPGYQGYDRDPALAHYPGRDYYETAPSDFRGRSPAPPDPLAIARERVEREAEELKRRQEELKRKQEELARIEKAATAARKASEAQRKREPELDIRSRAAQPPRGRGSSRGGRSHYGTQPSRIDKNDCRSGQKESKRRSRGKGKGSKSDEKGSDTDMSDDEEETCTSSCHLEERVNVKSEGGNEETEDADVKSEHGHEETEDVDVKMEHINVKLENEESD